jgi:GWxTD domain-containing protein
MKRTFILTAFLFLSGCAGAATAADVPAGVHDRSVTLYQQALGWLSDDTRESRRQALHALEEATLLEPQNTTYELALSRACYASGFLLKARQHLEHVALVESDDPARHLELGLMWRRDWLKYLDAHSLQRATVELVNATILDTTNSEAWLALEPLLLVQDNLGVAMVVAFRAARADPSRLEAQLAVASVCQRVGLTHEADSIFAATIPYLRRSLRERFEDLAPVVPEAMAANLRRMPAEQRAAAIERYWKERDPDPATPESEARLEYWSRVTQACFLFFDEKRGGWDERGDTYVRYGPPAEMKYNPVGEQLAASFSAGSDFTTGVQVWTYPELGMKITLQDRALSEDYLPPITRVAGVGRDDPLLPDYLRNVTTAVPDRDLQVPLGAELPGLSKSVGTSP